MMVMTTTKKTNENNNLKDIDIENVNDDFEVDYDIDAI